MDYLLSFLLFGTVGVVFNYLMRGNKPKQQSINHPQFSEDGIPLAEESGVIPVVFGTVEINASNVVGYAGYRTEEVEY